MLVSFIVLKTFCQDASGIGHLGSGHCWWMDLFNHWSSASHSDQHYPPVNPRTLGEIDAPSLLASAPGLLLIYCVCSLARGCRWLLINQRVGMELPHCTVCCWSVKPTCVKHQRNFSYQRQKQGKKNPEHVIHS